MDGIRPLGAAILVAGPLATFQSLPMLRLILPPNLPAAAARDAVAVRVELDRGAAPDPRTCSARAVKAALSIQCGEKNIRSAGAPW